MNAAIEQALANYLTSQLTVATPAVALAGTTSDALPSVSASIVCSVSLTWTVGPLYYGDVVFKITTPSHVTGFDVTTHRALTTAVRDAFFWLPTEDIDQAALNAAKQAAIVAALLAVGYTYQGHCKAPDQAIKDIQASDAWQTGIPAVFGLAEV